MAKTSVIIPTCNEAHHLPNLLKSLASHLRLDHELIVVDNGSTDDTAKIADQHGCKVIQLREKAFPSIARNAGVEASTGQLIVFLDADIIVTARWARELERLAQDLQFLGGGAITGDSYHMSLNPSWIERYWFEPLRRRKKHYINGGNIVLSRSAFDTIGGFNAELETGEDVDFCQRAQARGLDLVFNPELVVHHEGFPQDLKNFYRRERWHGKGDFANLHYFKNSRVAQISVGIGLCYLAIIALLGVAIMAGAAAAWILVGASLLVVLAVCCAASLSRFRSEGPSYSVVGTFIYFVYFNARLASLFRSLRGL